MLTKFPGGRSGDQRPSEASVPSMSSTCPQGYTCPSLCSSRSLDSSAIIWANRVSSAELWCQYGVCCSIGGMGIGEMGDTKHPMGGAAVWGIPSTTRGSSSRSTLAYLTPPTGISHNLPSFLPTLPSGKSRDFREISSVTWVLYVLSKSLSASPLPLLAFPLDRGNSNPLKTRDL